jgi:aminoglycoside phosphotransferase (APT) family kinase protein
MYGDVFALTRESAAELLRGPVPGARVTEVVRLSGGSVSGACEVRFAGAEEPVIVKVYGRGAGDRMVKELAVYRILREHGVTAVPRVLGSGGEDGGGALGVPYLVMSRLPGESAQAALETMDSADVAEVYRQMGAVLADVHRIEREAFGYYHRDLIFDPQPTNEAFMLRLAGRKLAQFAEWSGDRALHDAARDFIGDRGWVLAGCTVPRLLHNDFHELNVLVERTPDGPVVTGFIDVEDAMAGDPMADVAKTCAYSVRDDAVKLRGLREGYGAFPVGWEALVGLYRLIHGIELWDYFHETGIREPLDGLRAEMRALLVAG